MEKNEEHENMETCNEIKLMKKMATKTTKRDDEKSDREKLKPRRRKHKNGVKNTYVYLYKVCIYEYLGSAWEKTKEESTLRHNPPHSPLIRRLPQHQSPALVKVLHHRPETCHTSQSYFQSTVTVWVHSSILGLSAIGAFR